MAIADNIIVGTIALSAVRKTNAAHRKIFVKAAFRASNYGIGQVLLNTVFEWGAEKKLNKIFLGTAEKFVVAQRFYEKNGFVEIGKKLSPKEFPIMTVDVKFYKFIATL